jgi:hypothetical protein
MSAELNALERTIDVQRKFELLLLGQANANSALALMLVELSERQPEIRPDVDRIWGAMREATQVQVGLFEAMCGLTQRLETISRETATKH